MLAKNFYIVKSLIVIFFLFIKFVIKFKKNIENKNERINYVHRNFRRYKMTLNVDKKTIITSTGVAVVVALLVSFAACKLCSNNNEFGVVDLQRVVSASKDVANLRTNRQTQIAELQKMADDANKKIDEIKKDDEKKVATEKYLAEIQAKKAEFDNAYNASLKDSDTKIQNVINAVAEKKDLSIVLNKTSVVSGGVDITEAVIDLVK